MNVGATAPRHAADMRLHPRIICSPDHQTPRRSLSPRVILPHTQVELHLVASNPLTLVCRYQHHRPDACAARSACEAKYTSLPTSLLALYLPSRSLCSLYPLRPSSFKHYKHKSQKHGHRHQQRPCLCAARHRARSTPPVQWQCQSQQLVAPRPCCLRLPQYASLLMPNGHVYASS